MATAPVSGLESQYGNLGIVDFCMRANKQLRITVGVVREAI